MTEIINHQEIEIIGNVGYIIIQKNNSNNTILLTANRSGFNSNIKVSLDFTKDECKKLIDILNKELEK